MLAVNLALRFVLELAALAAIGLWGAAAGGLAGVLLATAGVLAAAVFWGVFCSPRARIHLPPAGKLAAQSAVFAVAAAGLLATGQPVPAAAFAVLVVLNAGLLPDHGLGRVEAVQTQ